jgi:hypothetical protein
MSVAIDSQMPSQAANTVSSVTSQSFSFTNTAGSVLYVIIGYVNSALTLPTAVSYGGNACTFISQHGANNNTGGYTAVYRLLNPPTGANTVSITFAASASWSTGCISFTGNKTTSPEANITTADDGGSFALTTFPVTVPGTTSGSAIIQTVVCGDMTTRSGTDNISCFNAQNNSSFAGNFTFQYKNGTGGSQTLSISNGGPGTSWGTIGFEILAAPSGAVSGNFFAEDYGLMVEFGSWRWR